MTDNASKDEVAALRAELNKLKPTSVDDAAMRQWQSDMHNLRERRAASFNPFSRDQLEEMERAAPTHVVRAIVGRDSHAPTGRPGTIPSSQQLSDARSGGGAPVNTSGWRNAPPLAPPPGVAQADRLMAAEELEFRRQRIEEEVQRRALRKAAEKASE